MAQYRITHVGPVETGTRKKAVYDKHSGQVSGYEPEQFKFQLVRCTDLYGNTGAEYMFNSLPDYVAVGDVISGWDEGGYIRDIIIESGKNAIARPAPPRPLPTPQPLPEVKTPQQEPWRFAVTSGYAATPADLASFAHAFFRLEAAFKKYVSEHP
jgi:hypothetical protein